MAIYGDQWTCGCGWANVFLRKRCRNCYLPKELAVCETPALQVIRDMKDVRDDRSDSDRSRR